MSEENNNNNNNDDSSQPALDEAKRQELIQKIKASLLVEDNENVQLYASLLKFCIP